MGCGTSKSFPSAGFYDSQTYSIKGGRIIPSTCSQNFSILGASQ
ncbi:hypothetical protein LINPERPRIM_LOCUS4998 [Linum perenne]